jgi:hypothetical protein
MGLKGHRRHLAVAAAQSICREGGRSVHESDMGSIEPIKLFEYSGIEQVYNFWLIQPKIILIQSDMGSIEPIKILNRISNNQVQGF